MRIAGAMLAVLLLAGSAGCVDEARVQEKGWKSAITCVEAHRSHEYCREPDRSDAPYMIGWNAAIACMESQQNLSRCREPALSQVGSTP